MARPLSGYPQSTGAKQESVLEITGPTSYTQVTTGSPPTGGQALSASQFGLKFLEFVSSCLSDDGQYIVFFTPASTAGSDGRGAVTSGILLWFVAHTGLEVTGGVNLSGRTVRLRAIGY